MHSNLTQNEDTEPNLSLFVEKATNDLVKLVNDKDSESFTIIKKILRTTGTYVDSYSDASSSSQINEDNDEVSPVNESIRVPDEFEVEPTLADLMYRPTEQKGSVKSGTKNQFIKTGIFVYNIFTTHTINF